MVLTVRAATPDDAKGAAGVLNPIILRGGTTALESPLTEDEVRDWFLCGPKVWCCHIAEVDGQIVGFQSVGRFGNLQPGWGEMGTYVQAGMAQHGIGTTLFRHTRMAARAIGLTHLNALIRSDNRGGLAYYARMGFCNDRPGPDAHLASGVTIARVCKSLAL